MSFTNNGDVWTASYTSGGDTVVQLERKGGGCLDVYANIEGMEKKSIASWTSFDVGQYVLFKACVPAGMTVTVESGSEVTAAKTLAVEGFGSSSGGCTCSCEEITMDEIDAVLI